MLVVDQNDIFRKFDFSSLITKEHDHKTCEVIQQIVADGNYFVNSPKFQTRENLFARTEDIWLKYRMSFLFSVFMYSKFIFLTSCRNSETVFLNAIFQYYYSF